MAGAGTASAPAPSPTGPKVPNGHCQSNGHLPATLSVQVVANVLRSRSSCHDGRRRGRMAVASRIGRPEGKRIHWFIAPYDCMPARTGGVAAPQTSLSSVLIASLNGRPADFVTRQPLPAGDEVDLLFIVVKYVQQLKRLEEAVYRRCPM